MGFTAKCDNCNATYEVEDEWAGMEAECPECNAKLTIRRNQSLPPETPDSPTTDAQNVCPNCQQLLTQNAIICVECGMNLKTRQSINSGSETKENSKRTAFTQTREIMYVLGYSALVFGGTSAIFNLINCNWEFLMWIDHWGSKTGWIIRFASMAAGGVFILMGRKPPEEESEEESAVASSTFKKPETSGMVVGVLGREVYVKKASVWIKLGIVALMLVLSLPTAAVIGIIATTEMTRGVLIGSVAWLAFFAGAAVYAVRVWRHRFGCCEHGVYLCSLFGRRMLLYSEIENARFELAERRIPRHGTSWAAVKVSFMPDESSPNPAIRFTWNVPLGAEEDEFGHIRDYVAGFVENVECNR